MGPGEIPLRLKKKVYQFQDSRYKPGAAMDLSPTGQFPRLPSKGDAPRELLDGLRRDVADILEGRWRYFGHLPLQVEVPPKWHKDYLVGRDFQSSTVAFKLDHRAQPNGGDIKIIWEPSRWNQLVRLAMGGWLLGDLQAREKCVEWLTSWCAANPPFTGLNWTSGLETGLRLVQFVWIDAFLLAAGTPEKTLRELRQQILPAHVWYTWRHRSFGSSANNHLIGELAGLILAIARWPELGKISAPLREIAAEFEREVLLQFAADGGNEEQATGYHLFSWEFCWQSMEALKQSSILVSTGVQERLRKAGEFYAGVKPEGDPWEFGDSDNAYVTPFFAREESGAAEWHRWFSNSQSSPSIQFWWGDFPKRQTDLKQEGGWKFFEKAGYAVFQNGDWFLRWDLSPLGYLSMAPHGHLDALHFSLWHKGQPIIIDPGTGCYYAEKEVRNFLADWAAHNGPRPQNPSGAFPRRFGTFLWEGHHAVPILEKISENTFRASIHLPFGTAIRTISHDPALNGFEVVDSFQEQGSQVPFETRLKFAPELTVNASGDAITTGPVSFKLSGYSLRKSFSPTERKVASWTRELGNVPLESLASPAFRKVTSAPFVDLAATGESGKIVIRAT